MPRTMRTVGGSRVNEFGGCGVGIWESLPGRM